MDPVEIERRIDRVITGAIPVSVPLGGVDPANYNQVMEYAKTMSTARHSIPEWLRGNVGDCLMICGRAMRWGMDPYFVAEKTYLMEGKGGTKIGYESQLVHAVIEAMAPLKGRLRSRYEGEGDDTICIVYGTFRGEDKPHEYPSVSVGKRIKDIGKSSSGNFRGSPMWLQKPLLQLFYDATRDWARMHCPDVLAGVYTRDELVDHEPVDVTPKISALAQRLRDATAAHADHRGFDANHVRDVSLSSIIEGNAKPGDAKQEDVEDAARNESDTERRKDDTESRGSDDRDQGGSEGVQRAGREDGGEPAGEESPGAQASEAGATDTEQAKDKASRK